MMWLLSFAIFVTFTIWSRNERISSNLSMIFSNNLISFADRMGAKKSKLLEKLTWPVLESKIVRKTFLKIFKLSLPQKESLILLWTFRSFKKISKKKTITTSNSKSEFTMVSQLEGLSVIISPNFRLLAILSILPLDIVPSQTKDKFLFLT